MIDAEEFWELQNNNAEKFKKLAGEYKKAFFAVYKPLAADAITGAKHENAVSDLLDKLLCAQREHKAVPEVFPNGLRKYYDELLNPIPEKPKKQVRWKRVVWLGAAAVIITLAAVFAALWQNGSVDVWSQGIGYFYGQMDRYGYRCTPVTDSFSVSVDLSNPQSNVGKTLYNKDGCKIEIGLMDQLDRSKGGYRIGFRSHGVYTAESALLVSGVKHITTEGRTFTANLTASMKTKYNGVTYSCKSFGENGMTGKDGDMFCFYLFPQEAYDRNQVTLNETGKAELTVSGLVKNCWYRK